MKTDAEKFREMQDNHILKIMNLTEIKTEQKRLKAKLKSLEVAEKKAKERSNPNRRLTKTEIARIKVMLQAGEEVRIIAKKSNTNIEVVRYWQNELNIEEPYKLKDIKELKSKPIRNFSDDEKALRLQKRNHDPEYAHYTLTQKGKERHDAMKKCPACFPESTMSLSEYNEFVRSGNFEAVQYMRKKERRPNKTLISSDKMKVESQLSDTKNGIFIDDAITPEQTVAERTWHPKDNPITERKMTKRERKLIKQMNNVPPEVITEFCKKKGISLT